MKKVNKEILKMAANNLMFDMSDEQYDALMDEFSIVQQQMKLIGEIEGLDDAEPMVFPYNASIDYLREDVAGTPLSQRDATKNAKELLLGQIKLPKVL